MTELEHAANEEARHGNREALKQLTIENERLRKALIWYRETVSMCNSIQPEGDEARNRLAKDSGNRAAKALEEKDDD